MEVQYDEEDLGLHDDAMGSLSDLASEYVRLDKIRRNLKDALDRVEDLQNNELQPKILAEMEHNGITSLNVNGLNVHSHSQLWVSREEDYDNVCDTLEDIGLDDYSQKRYNSHSLSAYFREEYEQLVQKWKEGELDQEEMPEPSDVIPAPLEGKIDLVERTKVKTRKS